MYCLLLPLRLVDVTGFIAPFVMTNLKEQSGLDQVIAFIEQRGMLQSA